MTTAQRLPKGFALFPKRLLVEQGLFAGMVWAGFSLVMLIIPIVSCKGSTSHYCRQGR